MLALENLKHPYIVPYKEFFVSWDKELSAMFVSVVCPYYPDGEVSQILAEHRDGNKAVDEQVKMESIILKYKHIVVDTSVYDTAESHLYLWYCKESNVFVSFIQTVESRWYLISTAESVVLVWYYRK